MKRSPIKRRSPLSRGTAPRRNTKVKRGNRLRKAREFARVYGSKERVAFVKSLPCVACRVVGYSENAHIPGAEGSGAGRKGNADQIVALCGSRTQSGWLVTGCHQALHAWGLAKFEALYSHRPLDLRVEAAKTEQMWQLVGGRAEPSGGEDE